MMSTKELVAQEVEKLPEPLVREVLDFARFLKAQYEREEDQLGKIDLSRTALAQEWEAPEEDEAWKDL